ncbi:MarR family transcriptional regulator [Micromonospora sp. S4605]|uniref:winged helix-turn-helix transcriptional regulator n=1 Tax=Micromonospora TaxID=1873 RepID=UPI000D6F1490|nr:helix-turn-helix domain-containing protein [Micromonospora sp. S4605]PWU55172.1 MarR family transcriptional regulator [Micromonospora sp. S4605]
MHWMSPDLVAGACPLSRTLDIIGGKWNAMIIRELLGGPRRFSQIRTGVGPISAKTLTERLRTLRDYDILDRTTAGEHVSYALTRRGQSLRPVLLELWRWGLADQESWSEDADEPGP